jgi:hypothetical protein
MGITETKSERATCPRRCPERFQGDADDRYHCGLLEGHQGDHVDPYGLARWTLSQEESEAIERALNVVGRAIEAPKEPIPSFEELRTKNLADLMRKAKEVGPAALKIAMAKGFVEREEACDRAAQDKHDGHGSLKTMALVVVGLAMWADE